MSDQKVIDLDRRIMAVCNCGSDLWHIEVDTVGEWELIKAFICPDCKTVISFHSERKSLLKSLLRRIAK